MAVQALSQTSVPKYKNFIFNKNVQSVFSSQLRGGY